MNDDHAQITEWIATVARRASDAREALEAAERAVVRRNTAVCAAAEVGVPVGTVVSTTGLSRAEVYRILDEANQ